MRDTLHLIFPLFSFLSLPNPCDFICPALRGILSRPYCLPHYVAPFTHIINRDSYFLPKPPHDSIMELQLVRLSYLYTRVDLQRIT